MVSVRAEYDGVRRERAARRERSELLDLAEARRRAPALDWEGYAPPRPAAPGIHVFDVPIAELRPYIDWTPFFQAWELRGKHPSILDDQVVGPEARKLLADAEAMLERLQADAALRPRAVVGFFPAASVGDDLEVYTDESRTHVRAVLHGLRQQFAKGDRENLCLSDFVAPAGSGKADWIGAFGVTAGHGVDALVTKHEAAHDDYSAILLKSLADRLAEALAERMHERVRRELWGYTSDESLDNDALISEAYRGIRPAPGYPACPDHTEKRTLFALLDAQANAGIELTESCAMLPAASVSGWYFAHPEARYFGVGRLGHDQVADYARRKGWSVGEAERWLQSSLGYEPGETS